MDTEAQAAEGLRTGTVFKMTRSSMSTYKIERTVQQSCNKVQCSLNFIVLRPVISNFWGKELNWTKACRFCKVKLYYQSKPELLI